MKFLLARNSTYKTVSDPSGYAELFGDSKDIQVADGFWEVFWTDESPASHYGIGVIEINGSDYGPRDIVTGDELGRTVSQWVVDSSAHGTSFGRAGFYSQRELEILSRFLGQWPDGPQFRF